MSVYLRLSALAIFLTFAACNTEATSATVEAEEVVAPPDKGTMPAPTTEAPTEDKDLAITLNEEAAITALKTEAPPAAEIKEVVKVTVPKEPKTPVAAPKPAPPTSTAPAAPATPTPAPVTTPAPKPAPAPTPPQNTAPDHSPWNQMLSTYVNGKGRVNYVGIKKNEAKLDAYLATLAKEIPASDWSRSEAMAYWINAYNAYTVKLILNNHPLGSITDLDGGDPWKVKWIKLAGKTYSLNNIEHDILRPKYKDPRIHFAVVCAAKSCPPIANRAFTAANLNSLLQSSTRAFINNSAFNQTKGTLKISKIFDWYKEDFGDVTAYLNKYLSVKIEGNPDVGFMDYDWSLNEQ